MPKIIRILNSNEPGLDLKPGIRDHFGTGFRDRSGPVFRYRRFRILGPHGTRFRAYLRLCLGVPASAIPAARPPRATLPSASGSRPSIRRRAWTLLPAEAGQREGKTVQEHWDARAQARDTTEASAASPENGPRLQSTMGVKPLRKDVPKQEASLARPTRTVQLRHSPCNKRTAWRSCSETRKRNTNPL